MISYNLIITIPLVGLSVLACLSFFIYLSVILIRKRCSTDIDAYAV